MTQPEYGEGVVHERKNGKNLGGHTPERILRNTGIMIGALSLQKIIALFYFALVARGFGAEITGEFFFATSVGMLLTVLLDSSQSLLLVQEGARDLAQARRDFRTMLAVKLSGAAALLAVGSVGLISFTPNALVFSFLVLIFFSSVCECLQMSCYAVLRAAQRHSIEGIAGIVGSLIELAIGTLVWRGALPLPMLVGAFLVANVFHLMLAGGVVQHWYGFSVLPDFSFERMRSWLARAAPFAIASYFTKVGTYTDSVLLRTFGGATALGLYSIPFKVSFSWLFIPQGFVATLFPAMSFFARGDRAQLARAFHRAIELLLFLAAPLAFGIAATAPTFVPRIFGVQYLSSTALIQVFAFLIFPLFLPYPIGSLLYASDRAAEYTKLLGISMLGNVLVNALLIPLIGVWGAIAAAFFSHTLLLVLGVRKARELIAFQWRRLGSYAARIFVSAVCMFVAVRLVSGSSLLWQIAVGFVVYIALTRVLNVWSKADLVRVWAIRYGQHFAGDTGVSAE